MIYECLAYKWNCDKEKDTAIEEIVAGPEVVAAADPTTAQIKFVLNMPVEWGTDYDPDDMRVLVRPFAR